MALDLSAGSLIRSGSGLLFVAVGVLVAALVRRGVENRGFALGLATYCVGFGSAFVTYNLGAGDAALARAFVGASLVGTSLATVAAAGMLLALRPTMARAVTYAATGSAAVGAALVSWATGAIGDPFDVHATAAAFQVARAAVGWVASTLVLLVAVELAFRHAQDPAGHRAAPLMAAALATYPAFRFGQDVLLPMAPAKAALLAVAGGALAAASVAWLWASTKGEVRRPRSVVWAALAVALLGMVVSSIGLSSTAYTRAGDTFGVIGVVRIGAAVALALAVLRYDALGTSLTLRSVRRGSLATAALAVLFIVAQVGQNFLSDSYGLLMGGIVAGAFLFAASPLQRAVERMNARDASGGASGPPSRVGGAGPHDEAYRAALRVAFSDRRLTRDEEIALADVAERLGIGARRAAEIRHDVEAEKGVR